MLTVSCPSCGTALALDPATLSGSRGWARCGHCQQIFDAAKSALPTLPPQHHDGQDAVLAELHPASAQPDAQTPQVIPVPPAAPVAWTHVDLDLPQWVNDPVSRTASDAHSEDEPTSTSHGLTANFTSSTQASHEPTLSEWQDGPTESAHTSVTEPRLDDSDSAALAAADPDIHLGQDTSVAHLGEASSTSTRRPMRRGQTWLLWFAFTALLLALLLQTVVAMREQIAARWPATQAWLTPMCEQLRCSIEPLQDLSQLQITHSSVIKLDEQRFQLDLEVRNDSQLTVAIPWVELSLQDAQNHVWSRRVMPMNTQTPQSLLGPSSRTAAQLFWHMDSSDAPRVEGYRLRLVYPSVSP